jgi:hypothetical protein
MYSKLTLFLDSTAQYSTLSLPLKIHLLLFMQKVGFRATDPGPTQELLTVQENQGQTSIFRLKLEGVAWSAQLILHGRILGFLDRSRYCFFHVAPQLYSGGWMDPVPYPPFLRKSDSAGNRTRDLWICSQELWPLYHRSGRNIPREIQIYGESSYRANNFSKR